MPVYFTMESSADLQAWYKMLARGEPLATDEIVLTTQAVSKGQIVSELNMDVFYGHETTSDSVKPIIAISASYDALGVAPTLPSGHESSLSALIGLMQIS